MTEQITYDIITRFTEYKGKQWYFATCKGMPTFLAHGPTLDILRERIESAVTHILTGNGMVINTILVVPTDGSSRPSGVVVEQVSYQNQ